MLTFEDSLNIAPPPADKIGLREASLYLPALRGLQAQTQDLLAQLDKGGSVTAATLSEIVDAAELCRIISIAGMRGNFLYATYRFAYDEMGAALGKSVAAPVLSHIHKEARRAIQILGQKGGYIPRAEQNRLYGTCPDTAGFVPLVP